MPINIIDFTGIGEVQKGNPIEYLSEGEWGMPKQVETLDKWLNEKSKKLPNLDGLSATTWPVGFALFNCK